MVANRDGFAYAALHFALCPAFAGMTAGGRDGKGKRAGMMMRCGGVGASTLRMNRRANYCGRGD